MTLQACASGALICGFIVKKSWLCNKFSGQAYTFNFHEILTIRIWRQQAPSCRAPKDSALVLLYGERCLGLEFAAEQEELG